MLIAMLSLAAATAPVAADAPLPGVSDKETTIYPSRIAQVVKGKGDVLFVRDQTLHWYRVALNKGCLSEYRSSREIALKPSNGSDRLDRFATVEFPGLGYNCTIQSIRASEAPPQVDSKSRVTLE